MKIQRANSVLFFLLFIAMTISRLAAASPSRLFERIKSGEPSFRDIMQVYLQREKLDDADLKAWRKKTKVAPYFPTLYVGYDQQLKKTESLSVTDNISVSSGDVTIGPEDNNYDLDNNYGQALHLRAVWNLDEIILSPATSALHQAKRDLIKARAEASESIYKIFEARDLFLVQYLAAKTNQPEKAALYYAKFLLLTDRLNQITDNEFINRFWRDQ